MEDVERGWLRRMLPFLRPHAGLAAGAVGLSLVGMVATGLTPAVARVIIDRAILTEELSLRRWTGVLLVLGAVRFVAALGRRGLGGQIGFRLEYDIRNRVYEHLHRLDFTRFDEMHTGQLVSRANSDIRAVQGFLGWLPLMVGQLLMFAVAFYFMFRMSVVLTLASMVTLPLLYLLAQRMRGRLFPAAWDAQQRAADVAAVVEEAVSGVRIVKAFGQERREQERLETAAADLLRSRTRAIRLNARFTPGVTLLPQLGIVVILLLGGELVLRGDLTLGEFLAFNSYLLILVAPIRMVGMMINMSQRARAAAERIFEILDSTPEVHEPPDAADPGPLAGDVVFDDVTFGYLRSEPVLRGFSLRVRPGETVALVGASGSGKSSVALLVPRFYDLQAGRVLVDGRDVRELALAPLRRQVAFVFEESFLFSRSIRDNIRYGRPDASDADVRAAAEAAGAAEFVDGLAEGYDTLVGENGVNLSGGQRQRLAIARALLADPRILILDDATSSVDVRTEAEIHGALHRLLAGRTTIVVAHRRSTVALADRVVLVAGGRVADEGTHDELVARNRLYRRLMADQSETGAEEPGAAPADGLDDELAQLEAEAAGALAAAGDGWSGRAAARGGPQLNLMPAGRDTGTGLHAGVGVGFGAGSVRGAGMGFGWADGVPATPELMARVAALPPPVDEPEVDVAVAARPDPDFNLRGLLRGFRGPLGAALGLVAADTLLGLAGPAIVRFGVDQGMAKGAAGTVRLAAALYLAALVLNALVVRHELVWVGRTGERLLYSLRVKVFAHLQRLGLDFYDREMAGRIMTRMTSDIEALSELLDQGIVQLLINALTLVGLTAVLFTIDWRLALVTLTIVPPLVAATLVFRAHSARAYLRVRERVAAVLANLQEGISGIKVTQTFAREDLNAHDFRMVTREHLDAQLDSLKVTAVYLPAVETLGVVGIALVLYAGAGMIGAGLTAGGLIAFVLYLNTFFAPVQQLSQVFDTYQRAGAAVTQLRELLRTPSSVPEAPDAVTLATVRGDVRFDGVSFRYEAARGEALAGVDLEIRAGETVALVGETGAGKSTILKLAARFYDPVEGTVSLDGVDLRRVAVASVRRHVAVVPQEAFLFDGTIRDNIAYGRPAATDAEVQAAAEAVGAHDVIRQRPDGYLSHVGERGRALSSGERQLIALARAWLADPRVLLLDEATSNLDLETEAKVRTAMRSLAAGRTTLLIAHRLSSARQADRIAVVHRGRMVEQGDHDTLMAAGGVYASMYRQWMGEDALAAS